MIDILGLLRGLFARLLGDLVPPAEPSAAEDQAGEVVRLRPRRAPAPPDVAQSNGGKPPLELSRHLPPEPAAVPEARAALEPLAAVIDPEAFDNLRLLVTELVTNSVRHGSAERSSDIELSVVASPDRIRTQVADQGPGFRARDRSAGDNEGSGWGLHLVGRLSDRWGVEQNGRSIVWFELEAEFQPEWWLSEPTVDTRAPAKGASAGGTYPPSRPVRRLAFVPFVGRSQQLETDVD